MLQADGRRPWARLHRRDECGTDLAGPEAELDRQRLALTPLAPIHTQPAVPEMIGPGDAGPLGIRHGPAVELACDGILFRRPKRPRMPGAHELGALARVALAAGDGPYVPPVLAWLDPHRRRGRPVRHLGGPGMRNRRPP